MSNVIEFKVTNEDAKHLCDFMGIDAVKHGEVVIVGVMVFVIVRMKMIIINVCLMYGDI